MSSVDKLELHRIRLAIAIKICLQHPTLWRKLFQNPSWKIYPYEETAAKELKAICDVDNCVRRTLEFYYKREGR